MKASISAIRDKIRHRKIELLSAHINRYDEPLRWKCKECNYIWHVEYHRVVNDGTGCPRCAHHVPITINAIRKKIRGRPIRLLSNAYVNAMMPLQWLCKAHACNHVWTANYNRVINKGTGCPKCAKKAKPTISELKVRIKNRPITLVSSTYENSKTPLVWKCRNKHCGISWEATAHCVVYKNTGCPNCKHKAQKALGAALFALYRGRVSRQQKIQDTPRKRFADFVIQMRDKKSLWIEYDGEQHFRSVGAWGGNKAYAELKRKDKKDYVIAKRLNLVLVRFNYRQFDHKTPKFKIMAIVSKTLEGLKYE